MIKARYLFVLLLLSSIMLIGCGKPTTEASGDSDNCIVVQTPEGSIVEDLFDFKSKGQIALSNWGDDYGDVTMYHVGTLADGNSIVWQSGTVFLYVPGKTKDTSILHYKNRLQDDPISYDDFKELRDSE